MEIREPGHPPVGRREGPAVAEGVEPVLRAREHRDARDPAGGEPQEVGVDEVRVDDLRGGPAHQADEPTDEDRRGRGVEAQLLDVHPALAEPRRELRRPGLVLVEHREANVVPAFAQRGEEEQEVVL